MILQDRALILVHEIQHRLQLKLQSTDIAKVKQQSGDAQTVWAIFVEEAMDISAFAQPWGLNRNNIIPLRNTNFTARDGANSILS